MIPTALKTYLTLASGLTEVTKARAVAAAKALASSGEATVGQVGALAEDLMTTSRGNRDALALLVHSEVDRALGRLGLATADEVRQLTSRLKAAEAKLREIDAPSPTVAPAPTGVTSATPPAKRPATKKPTVAKATRAKANGTKA